MVKSDNTLIQWTCHHCYSGPFWFIWECKFCKAHVCNKCKDQRYGETEEAA